MVVEVTSLVWQLVEAAVYKPYKICHVVGFKKNQCYSLRFLPRAPTEIMSPVSRIVPKTLKRTLWGFLTAILLQNIKKLNRDALEIFEKFLKNVSENRKRREVS